MWTGEIEETSEKIKLPIESIIPEDIGVYLVVPNGYSSWEDVLNVYDDLEIKMEMLQQGKVIGRYVLSIQPSENCRLLKSVRKDGKFNIGWRLINKSIYVDAFRILITDRCGVIPSKSKIEVLKLP